jgi:NTP pyrophosphatase (non-canonical NTP hydrolase)
MEVCVKLPTEPPLELTEAERLFDDTVHEQRRKGRRTYGKGLEWRDGAGDQAPFDWRQMALEEACDLSQYLVAELARVRAENGQLHRELQAVARGDVATLDGYQREALRTAATGLGNDLTVRALGLAGEVGEVVEHVKKHVGHGHSLDNNKVVKELGDVLWYVATLAAAVGASLEDVAKTNIEKLRTRYPDGFSVDASQNRVA